MSNRMVMAPLTRNRASMEGVPQDINATYYAQRASAGLIITEATATGIVLNPYYKAPAVALRGVGVTTSGDLSSTSFTNKSH